MVRGSGESGIIQIGSLEEEDDFDENENGDGRVPFVFVIRARRMLGEVEKRLASDIYRGIMLEVVQRVVGDISEKFVNDPERNSNYLVAALANLTYILHELLPEDTTDHTILDDQDLTRTDDSIWSMVQGSYQSVLQFFSVFEFIEDSMPQLKRE